MPPAFLYFDLGNVVLFFSHEQGIRQMADVAGIDVSRVREAVYDVDLQTGYERGELTGRQYYEIFCQRTGTRPDFDEIARAAGDIFTVNVSLKPILSSLAAAGHRLGLLSNTCDIHWNNLADGRYATIPDIFETVVLSYQVGAVKPEPKIYRAAAETARVPPGAIFFVDDIPGHVEAARACGFDAVQYTTTPALVADLRQRGLRFNY